MRKAYWPYRGVDSVCFRAEYGLVVLCLGLEAGELSTRALVRISAHISKVYACAQVIFGRIVIPLSTCGRDEKGASSYSLIIMRTVFCTK